MSFKEQGNKSLVFGEVQQNFLEHSLFLIRSDWEQTLKAMCLLGDSALFMQACVHACVFMPVHSCAWISVYTVHACGWAFHMCEHVCMHACVHIQLHIGHGCWVAPGTFRLQELKSHFERQCLNRNIWVTSQPPRWPNVKCSNCKDLTSVRTDSTPHCNRVLRTNVTWLAC